jgi:hypothetical protein
MAGGGGAFKARRHGVGLKAGVLGFSALNSLAPFQHAAHDVLGLGRRQSVIGDKPAFPEFVVAFPVASEATAFLDEKCSICAHDRAHDCRVR